MHPDGIVDDVIPKDLGTNSYVLTFPQQTGGILFITLQTENPFFAVPPFGR
jgi:hypothetical protein